MTLGVLITYHNERELLTKCLESVRRQTSSVNEILVYDDASNYPASSYVPAGLSVRVIRSDANRGPACGRNVLMRASRSDYIHFHDSDDLFHPQWSAEVRKRLVDPHIEAVFTEISFFGEDGTLGGSCGLGLRALQQGEDIVRFCLRGSMLTPSGTYATSAALRIGGYRETLWQSEDWDFHIRLAASGVRYCIVEDTLVLCRSRATSRSRNRLEVFISAVQAAELLADELPPKYHLELSERVAGLGSAMFRLGAVKDARAAFQLAAALGSPRFSSQRLLYRGLARVVGPEVAERTGEWYRRVIPRAVRSALSAAGV